MVQGGGELQRRPSSPRRSALGVCVCAPVPGSALVTGTAAARAPALATAPLPKPMAGGSCQRRGRWRPGSGAQKAGGREGGGERTGGRRLPCLLPSVAAPVPSWGRASPPGGAEFPLSGGAACAPAFCRGPHPAPLPQAGSSPGRGVSAAGRPAWGAWPVLENFSWWRVAGEWNESPSEQGMGGAGTTASALP